MCVATVYIYIFMLVLNKNNYSQLVNFRKRWGKKLKNVIKSTKTLGKAPTSLESATNVNESVTKVE